MTHDPTERHSRRSLLTGVLAAMAAVAATTLGGAQRVFAAGDDDAQIQIGHAYADARNATSLENAGNDHDVFLAQSDSYGVAVTGTSYGAVGVRGVATKGDGVQGWSHHPLKSGVWGDNDSGGYGVVGSTAGEDASAGVAGLNRGDGTGVIGYSGPSTPADLKKVGVYGLSEKGRGGVFGGEVAPIRLLPSGDDGHPHQGAKGDLVVDRSGHLWFCRGGTRWTRIA